MNRVGAVHYVNCAHVDGFDPVSGPLVDDAVARLNFRFLQLLIFKKGGAFLLKQFVLVPPPRRQLGYQTRFLNLMIMLQA